MTIDGAVEYLESMGFMVSAKYNYEKTNYTFIVAKNGHSKTRIFTPPAMKEGRDAWNLELEKFLDDIVAKFNDTPKLKVGDKFKVVRADHNGKEQYIGRVFTVRKVDHALGDSIPMYSVEEHCMYKFREDEIVPVFCNDPLAAVVTLLDLMRFARSNNYNITLKEAYEEPLIITVEHFPDSIERHAPEHFREWNECDQVEYIKNMIRSVDPCLNNRIQHTDYRNFDPENTRKAADIFVEGVKKGLLDSEKNPIVEAASKAMMKTMLNSVYGSQAFRMGDFEFRKGENGNMIFSYVGGNKDCQIKKVHFNNPMTIVIWSDGTKTIVKAKNEAFDPEKGLAMAIAKKAMGNKYNYIKEFEKWIPKKEETEDQLFAYLNRFGSVESVEEKDGVITAIVKLPDFND